MLSIGLFTTSTTSARLVISTFHSSTAHSLTLSSCSPCKLYIVGEYGDLGIGESYQQLQHLQVSFDAGLKTVTLICPWIGCVHVMCLWDVCRDLCKFIPFFTIYLDWQVSECHCRYSCAQESQMGWRGQHCASMWMMWCIWWSDLHSYGCWRVLSLTLQSPYLWLTWCVVSSNHSTQSVGLIAFWKLTQLRKEKSTRSTLVLLKRILLMTLETNSVTGEYVEGFQSLEILITPYTAVVAIVDVFTYFLPDVKEPVRYPRSCPLFR